MPILLFSAQVTKRKEQRQRRARNNRSYEEGFSSYDKIPASILYIKGIDAGIFYYTHISILTK
jgi:hypothetical protein